MAPEYAIDGKFSVKSDVYSFGVMILEIVGGKKNRGFNHHDHDHSLLGHVRDKRQEINFLPKVNTRSKKKFKIIFTRE